MKTSKPLLLLGALGALSAAAGDAAAVDTSQWKCESCPFEKESTTGTVAMSPSEPTCCTATTNLFNPYS